MQVIIRKANGLIDIDATVRKYIDARLNSKDQISVREMQNDINAELSRYEKITRARLIRALATIISSSSSSK